MLKKLFATIFALLLTSPLLAQQNKILPVGHPAYEYIKQLQHRGHLLELNPTSLPYLGREVSSSLQQIDESELSPLEKEWYRTLLGFSSIPSARDSAEVQYGVNLKGAMDLSSSKRLDPLRPLKEDFYAFPSGFLGGYLENPKFIAHGAIRHSIYYDRHPDGLDAARRLYIRPEESYLGFNGDFVDIYLGRFKNHWAPSREASSILSSNPYSYDQLNIRLGYKNFSFRSVMAELDNISSSGNFTGENFGSGSTRRFLVSHRFDWRPSNHFGIAFFESVLYSGENSGLSLKYFNPLFTYTFLSDNYPKNDENNLLFGGLLWFQWRGFTVNGQLMFDDIIVQEKSERNTYTLTGSIVKANAFRNTDLGLEAEAVSYQSYNTDQAEGRYLYLKTGLATQFNDYIKANLYANIYPHSIVKGLRITPKIEVLWQGEQTINQPFKAQRADGSLLPSILTGTEQRTLRPGLEFRYQKSEYFWIEGDVGMNAVQDYLHQPSVNKTRFTAMLSIGFNLPVLDVLNAQ